MSDNKYMSKEMADKIVDAYGKYESALASKVGIPQCKNALTNLLITGCGSIVKMLEGYGEIAHEMEILEEENKALSENAIEKHKEIAELNERIEELTSGGKKGSKKAPVITAVVEDGMKN